MAVYNLLMPNEEARWSTNGDFLALDETDFDIGTFLVNSSECP